MITYLISGLGLGSVYAIIALGYTMVYGIVKMLNFAHGDVIMVGGYVAFFALSTFNLPLPLTLLLTIIICALLGFTIEKLAYKPLRGASSLSVLITAIGVSYFLQNSAQLLFSSSTKVFPMLFKDNINIFGTSIAIINIITILTCIIIMSLLTLFINKTKNFI